MISIGSDVQLELVQLYVDGEFVGGADILDEMVGKGELMPLLRGQP